jgi:DNA primase
MASKEQLKDLRSQADQAISHNPVTAFPEFAFRRNGKGWVSSNALKVDGTLGTALNKVWIYDNNPGYLFDFRGNVTISFWDYFQKVRGFSNPFNELMALAGLHVPKDKPLHHATPDLVANTHPAILRACLTLFAEELEHVGIGQAVNAYLLEKRGYSQEIIRKMRLGALPTLDSLNESLSTLPIEKKYLTFFIKNMEKFTAHHPLVIPCFGKHGQLEGFIFRTLGNAPAEVPKYRNMMGLVRDGGILNVPLGETEIVVVEGVLDALLAQAHGFPNTVSLNGSGLNDGQLDALAEIGVQRIILCLDHDETGEASTARIAHRILAHPHPFELYVASLPFDRKDADEVMVNDGIEDWQRVLHDAQSAGEYLALLLSRQHPHKVPGGMLPALPRAKLLEACARYYGQLGHTPLHQHDLLRDVHRHIDDATLPLSLVQSTIEVRMAETSV